MTITLGWWLLPLIITVVLITWMALEEEPGDYAFRVRGFVAVPGILFVWLVWALAKIWSGA